MRKGKSYCHHDRLREKAVIAGNARIAVIQRDTENNLQSYTAAICGHVGEMIMTKQVAE